MMVKLQFAATLACAAWAVAGSSHAAFLRSDIVQQPTTEEKRAAWPIEARREPGYTAALCQVDPAGVVSACETILETPQGKGVGAALLSLAPKYRMKPIRGPCSKSYDRVVISLAWPAPDEGAGWASQPNAKTLRTAYPIEARVTLQPGVVVMTCAVDGDGSVSQCAAILEEPLGFMFGRAAESLAPKMRMTPAKTSGEPAPSLVTVPINFIPDRMRCEPPEE